MKRIIRSIILVIAGLIMGYLVSTFVPISPRHQTNTEQKDEEMTVILGSMRYNECLDIQNGQFGYLIDRIKESTRAGNIVQFGEDEFEVSVLDSTDNYPYRLKGEKFSVYINPKHVIPNTFLIMKTWDVPEQDKYNE